MEIKDYLKKLREEKNVSQQSLADRLHISRSVVAKWETGIQVPQREYLVMIADFFEIDFNEFLKNIDLQTNQEKRKIFKKRNIAIIASSCLSILLIILFVNILKSNNTKELYLSDYLDEMNIYSIYVIDNETNEKYQLEGENKQEYTNAYYDIFDSIYNLSIEAYKKYNENEKYDDLYTLVFEDNNLNTLKINSSYFSFNEEMYNLKSVNEMNILNESIDKILDSSTRANIIFELDKSSEFYIVKGIKKEFKKLVIPDTFMEKPVRVISKEAFKNNNSLTTISLPNTINKIEEEAFFSCVNLFKIEFSNSLEIIEDYAFRRCSNLKEVVIPDSVKIIGKGIFDECIKIEKITIPFIGSEKDNDSNAFLSYLFDGYSYEQNDLKVPESLKILYLTKLEEIRSYCFYKCKYIKEIYLPSTITYIGEYAFSECSSINILYFDEIVNDLEIDNHAFLKSRIRDVYWNGDFDTWMNIDFNSNASNPNECSSNFYIKVNGSFVSPSEVFIKKDVKRIKPFVFYKLDISKVIFEEGSTLEIIDNLSFAFSYIREITIPKSVKEIDISAFNSCKLLSKVEFEEDSQIEKIGAWCFDSSGIKEIKIPDSVQYLGSNMFKGVNEITYISLPFLGNKLEDNNDAYYLFDDEIIIDTIEITRQEILPDECFSSFENIRNVIIGSGVKKIGKSAFQTCDSIETVILGENVIEIGDYAFSSCYNLAVVCNLSDLNIEYNQDAYNYGGLGLRALWIGDDIEKMPNIIYDETGEFKFICVEDVYYLVSVNDKENIVLPDYINGQSYHLNDYLFTTCDSLVSITFGKGVLSVGKFCFFLCDNLKEVKFNEGLKEIGEGAFNQCHSLEVVEFPKSIVSIGDEVFYFCDKLKEVYIHKGVINMGKHIFSSSIHIEKIYVCEESEPSTWNSEWDRWEDDLVIWGYDCDN